MASNDQPAVAIIGGSGLSQFFPDAVAGEYVSTPYGDTSGVLSRIMVGAVPVVFLPRHGHPHAVPPHCINYRANIWALRERGVRQVFAVNAVGGINSVLATGAIVIPDQLIDYTYGREHTYADGSDGAVLNHYDFSFPFDAGLRERLLATSAELDAVNAVDGGVYGVTQGPRLETAAEIRRMKIDGCDMVGMTAMPEAGLARELGLAYASICLVVNPAAGCSDQLITMDDINRVLAQGMDKVRSLLVTCISSFADAG